MLKASESIRLWLESQVWDGNQDLISRILSHGTDLELQVNVGACGGEPIAGKQSSYTDGVNEWFSFRIPKGAATEPHWKDFALRYPLDKYVDSIGSTGWNWAKKISLWVGFDFDSVSGHAAGVGVSDQTLADIRRAVQDLPYVESRKSTRGQGLHLYVHLPEVPTNTHTEHAALARCVLGQISTDIGLDLGTHVDCLGGNMWIASRRATPANGGLKLLKPATRPFDNIPPNWKDHIDVVKRTRTRVQVAGVAPSEEDEFQRLASATPHVKLTEQHIKHRDRLTQLGCGLWIPDHHLIQTHTCLLKKIHTEFELPGVFETLSQGKDLGTPNCFAYPLLGDAWKVVRFGTKTKEAATWDMTGEWTTCVFGRAPSFSQATDLGKGVLTADGSTEFLCWADAEKAIKIMYPDEEITVPKNMRKQTVFLRERRMGGKTVLVISLTKLKRGQSDVLPGWSGKRKDFYDYVISATNSNPQVCDGVNQSDYDNLVRCLETPARKPAGWMIKKEDDSWTEKTASSVRAIFQKHGVAKGDVDIEVGEAEVKPWCRVSIPFSPEYPGGRQWNLNAPQLRIHPAEDNDEHLTDYGSSATSPHPHWDMILQHIGQSLDDSLRRESWAVESGVVTGQMYLQCWMSALIRYPFAPLPYLFLFGPENSGKSIFHEAFSLLVTHGVVKADRALTSSSDFNGELEGCILAVVEEKDVAKAQGALSKIKDAVTSPMISIRRMRTDTYEVPNTTHWVQCSNSIDFCPIFPGDTRIVACHVGSVQVEIPKPVLMQHLNEEAPYFLRTLFQTVLPPSGGRLRIPVVNTSIKQMVSDTNATVLDKFILDNTVYAADGIIPFGEFYSRFMDSKPTGEVWTKIKVSKDMIAMPNISLTNGTANVRIIRGLLWNNNTK